MTLETIYDGNGSLDDFNTNFDYLEQEDISVAVQPSGGSYATKTLDTHYTVSGQVVTFTSGNVPPNNSKVRIRRHTPVTQPRHTFYAGSTVTAKSLNDNTNQILNALEERGLAVDDETDQPFTIGTHNEIKVNSATNLEVVAGKITNNHMAINSIDSDQYVDGSIDHVHLSADAIDGDNISNDSINSEHYVDGSIDHVHLSNDCIDGDNIQDDSVNSEHIAAGAVDLEHMSSESVDEDNLHISNAGSNGQYLQKSAGSPGLTWASINLPVYASTSDNTARTFSDDTWTAVGLSIAYTPSFASSKILLNAYVDLYPKGRADTASQQFAWFRWRMRLDGSSTIGPEQFIRHGYGYNNTYMHYNTEKKWQWHFWREYTNSNTNAKTFSLELYETDTSILQMNTDLDSSGVGTSYFTLTELAV